MYNVLKFMLFLLLLKTTLISKQLGGNKIWTQEESTKFAKDVYMGEHNAGQYIYMNVDKTGRYLLKGSIVDLCKLLYAKRRAFALEGILIEMFGQKKEKIVTENVYNETERMFYERRFTELLEHLYYLLKKPCNEVHVGKEVCSKKNLLNVKMWDNSKNKQIRLVDNTNSSHIKNFLYCGLFLSDNILCDFSKESPDKYIFNELKIRPFIIPDYKSRKTIRVSDSDNNFLDNTKIKNYERLITNRNFDPNLSNVSINITPFLYSGLEFSENISLNLDQLSDMKLKKVEDINYISLDDSGINRYLCFNLRTKRYRVESTDNPYAKKNCNKNNLLYYYQNNSNIYTTQDDYRYNDKYYQESLFKDNDIY